MLEGKRENFWARRMMEGYRRILENQEKMLREARKVVDGLRRKEMVEGVVHGVDGEWLNGVGEYVFDVVHYLY